MTTQDLELLIQQKEGLKIEFKEAANSVPSCFYETVVSFSNTDGGTILLGVNDNGIILGIDPSASVKLQKDIITALNSPDCINPPLYVQPFTVQHPDGLVMVIQVPASSQLHDHSGQVYSREFESDLDITNNDQKKSNLYLRKRNFFSEAQIYPYLRFEDLEPSLFDKARQIIRNNKSDHPWLLVNNEQMLRDSVLWRKDFMSDQEGLTLAAALVFGKESTIQSLLPAYKVEAMVRKVNVDRWDDRITLRKNLIETYLELKQFVNKHLPESFYMEGDQRVDLRDKIFREVIGNVIVHREYTSALSTEMLITNTEVIFTNPNKPLFHGPIDPHGFNPYPKNPNIRKFFTAFGWTDEIGSGVRNTNKYLPLYIPGALPVFWENDTFKTQIPLRLSTLGTFASDLQQWLSLPAESLQHISSGLRFVALTPSLAEADWETALLHLVPTWHQSGTNLAQLNWPENQVHTKEQIEKVPTWAQSGTNLLRKKVAYLISILTFSTSPISLDQLMRWMNYKNRKTFRENYLTPLQQVNFITRTNPENLNDPNQQYVITEAGKSFLGGQ